MLNSRSCPTSFDPPSAWMFGVGFLLHGTERIVLSGNVAKENAGPLSRSGGIVVESSETAEPTDNVVEQNVARDNGPFDIRWDETGSGNIFRDNTCKTSYPSWICAASG